MAGGMAPASARTLDLKINPSEVVHAFEEFSKEGLPLGISASGAIAILEAAYDSRRPEGCLYFALQGTEKSIFYDRPEQAVTTYWAIAKHFAEKMLHHVEPLPPLERKEYIDQINPEDFRQMLGDIARLASKRADKNEACAAINQEITYLAQTDSTRLITG